MSVSFFISASSLSIEEPAPIAFANKLIEISRLSLTARFFTSSSPAAATKELRISLMPARFELADSIFSLTVSDICEEVATLKTVLTALASSAILLSPAARFMTYSTSGFLKTAMAEPVVAPESIFTTGGSATFISTAIIACAVVFSFSTISLTISVFAPRGNSFLTGVRPIRFLYRMRPDFFCLTITIAFRGVSVISSSALNKLPFTTTVPISIELISASTTPTKNCPPE